MKTDNKYSRKYSRIACNNFDWKMKNNKNHSIITTNNYSHEPTEIENEYSMLWYKLIFHGRMIWDQVGKDYKIEQGMTYEQFRKANPKCKDLSDSEVQKLINSYHDTTETDYLESNPPQEIIEFYNKHFLCYFDHEFTNIFGKPIKIEDNYSTLFIKKEELIENIVDPDFANVPENQKEAYLDHIYKQYVGMVNEIWN